MSPGKLLEAEQSKLEKLSVLSTSILELNQRQCQLNEEKDEIMKQKYDKLKKMRLEEYKLKSAEIDEKERELCRQTNHLMDELINTGDDSNFHKALIQILSNMKG